MEMRRDLLGVEFVVHQGGAHPRRIRQTPGGPDPTCLTHRVD